MMVRRNCLGRMILTDPARVMDDTCIPTYLIWMLVDVERVRNVHQAVFNGEEDRLDSMNMDHIRWCNRHIPADAFLHPTNEIPTEVSDGLIYR